MTATAAAAAERERQSADARSAAGDVVAQLHSLADQLDELAADLRAEVERRRERNQP